LAWPGKDQKIKKWDLGALKIIYSKGWQTFSAKGQLKKYF
jgi:hypothetical protein